MPLFSAIVEHLLQVADHRAHPSLVEERLLLVDRRRVHSQYYICYVLRSQWDWKATALAWWQGEPQSQDGSSVVAGGLARVPRSGPGMIGV